MTSGRLSPQALNRAARHRLEIEPLPRWARRTGDAVMAEGERLLGFAAPAIAVRDVRFVPVRSG